MSTRNITLSHLDWTVHRVGAILKKAMEMKTGTLVAKLCPGQWRRTIEPHRRHSGAYLVVHVDNDILANREVEYWERPLTIDSDHWPLGESIGIPTYPGDIEVVGFCADAADERRRAHKQADQST